MLFHVVHVVGHKSRHLAKCTEARHSHGHIHCGETGSLDILLNFSFCFARKQESQFCQVMFGMTWENK